MYTIIACHNSHFGRDLFSLFLPITTVENTDIGTQRPLETAILKIGQQRTIRNVGIIVSMIGSILLSQKLFAVITAGSTTHLLTLMKNKIANIGEQLFGSSSNGSLNPPPPPQGNFQ
jgi:hypothetical protein